MPTDGDEPEEGTGDGNPSRPSAAESKRKVLAGVMDGMMVLGPKHEKHSEGKKKQKAGSESEADEEQSDASSEGSGSGGKPTKGKKGKKKPKKKAEKRELSAEVGFVKFRL